MRAIVVTGSRRWTDHDAIRAVLVDRLKGHPRSVVIHGDAGGADRIAGMIARELVGVSELPMPAHWDKLGKRAGPIRNSYMHEVAERLRCCGYQVELHAFPTSESKGTWDCVHQFRRGGLIPVTVHEERQGRLS